MPKSSNNLKFDLGATCHWTSSAQGVDKTKEGLVAQLVPAGKYPDRETFPHLYMNAGVGLSRNHESYVVLVGKRPYWPRVKHLKPGPAQNTCPGEAGADGSGRY